MTVGLEAARPRPAMPEAQERTDTTDALEDIIAAHRAALLALAPHQAWRSVREDTGWHMAQLGTLLCVRDSGQGRVTPCPGPQHPALAALRAGQAARVQAGLAYREAGDDPVEQMMTLLPLAQGEEPPQQHNTAPGGVPDRERRESNGTARS